MIISGLDTQTIDSGGQILSQTYTPQTGTINNSGTASGINVNAGTYSITNSGTLTGESNPFFGFFFNPTIVVFETDAATAINITNESGGLIDGFDDGSGESAGMAIGVVDIVDFNGAPLIANPNDPVINVTNAGTIDGDLDVTTLDNSGTITAMTIEADTIVNSGTLIGRTDPVTGSSFVVLEDVSDPIDTTLTLQTGSDIQGDIDAAGGTDALVLEGTGSEDGGFINFESLTMQGEDWTLSGNSSFDSISVDAGILRVNGMFSPLSLSFNGGGLGGTGTINGSVSGASTISPGDVGAIGTLTISGDFASAAGSTFAVDINPTGSGDLLSVGGTPDTSAESDHVALYPAALK